MDIVTASKRSEMMAGIRSKETRPEIVVFNILKKSRRRFVCNCPELPGKPDFVFKRSKQAIFVHGCFWHYHDCNLFRLPGTNEAFWQQKLEANRTRDQGALRELKLAGWRVLEVWECSMRGPTRLHSGELEGRIISWLRTSRRSHRVRGRRAR